MHVVSRTSIYAAGAKVMKDILGYSKTSKKFSPAQEEKLKTKIMVIGKEIDEVDKKSPEFSDHCRTFREIMQTAFWVFVVPLPRSSPLPSSCSRAASSQPISGP